MPEPIIKHRAKPSAELLEESVALLRQAPASALIAYFTGAVPFWLGLLYFIADMSSNAYARERLATGSLGMACLFFWMKCWQAVFASQLRSALLGESPEPWNASRVVRLVTAQMNIQSWGLLIRPVALMITLPVVWVSAFYQNATILGDGSRGDGRSLSARAWHQATLWPGQAHGLVSLLSLFGFFIWLNVVITTAVLPQLLKQLFGVETMFSRNPYAMLNTTVFTATVAVTFLCLDPIWKTAFLLRCFYGESLRSGADLRVQLNRLRPRTARAAAALIAAGAVLFGAEFAGAPARAESPRPPAADSVDASKLDQSIGAILEQREYAWRNPRKPAAAAEAKKGALDSWIEGVGKAVQKILSNIRQGIKKALKWLFGRWFKGSPHPKAGGESSLPPVRKIVYVLIGAGVALLLWAVWRAWRAPRAKTVAAEAVKTVPDLGSEDITADQLPEDGWLQLARELMDKGELRLALRAAYLAGLAHLGHRELLTIARHKSNRDYDRELRRRARSRGELLAAFEDNMNVFERVWYGLHDVTTDTLAHFQTNLEKIRAC